MKIDSITAGTSQTGSAAAGNSAAAGFADALANSLKVGGDKEEKLSAAEIAAHKAEEKRQAQAAEHQAAAGDLRDYLSKSPAQHLREQVMKELGISEEDLAKMPPEKRKTMEAEINRRVREKLASTEKQRGARPGELEQGGPADPRLFALDHSPAEAQTTGNSAVNAAFFASLLANSANAGSGSK